MSNMSNPTTKAPTPVCLHCNRLLYWKENQWSCQNESCLLAGLEQDLADPAAIVNLNQYRRQMILEQAMDAADRIILEESNGTEEETNCLTSAFTLQWMRKVHSINSSRLNRKEIVGHYMPEHSTFTLLQTSLSVAVPLYVHRFKQTPWQDLDKIRNESVEEIASHGDNLLYRSKKVGDSAKAFNALAQGIAILSFLPGGVTIFGLHFEESHPEVGRVNMYPVLEKTVSDLAKRIDPDPEF